MTTVVSPIVPVSPPIDPEGLHPLYSGVSIVGKPSDRRWFGLVFSHKRGPDGKMLCGAKPDGPQAKNQVWVHPDAPLPVTCRACRRNKQLKLSRDYEFATVAVSELIRAHFYGGSVVLAFPGQATHIRH